MSTIIKTEKRGFEASRFYPVEVNGKIVQFPSVTTITGMVTPKYWLLPWYLSSIKKSLAAGGTAEEGIEACQNKTKTTQNFGIDVHAVAHASITGDDTPFERLSEADPKLVDDVAIKYVTWVKDHFKVVLLCEAEVHSITHRYAGRLDLDGELHEQTIILGKKAFNVSGICVVDVKTGARRAEHQPQLGGYWAAREEQFGVNVDWGAIVYVSEKEMSIEWFNKRQLRAFFEQFLHMKATWQFFYDAEQAEKKLREAAKK